MQQAETSRLQGHEAGTATEAARREALGDEATHLHHVDDHREEVDPPLGGDSTRLGLEPRSHRQQLPLERQQRMLDEDVKW